MDEKDKTNPSQSSEGSGPSGTTQGQPRYNTADPSYEAKEKELRRRHHKQIADGIGVGITFIFIGVVWLLSRFGYLNVSLVRAIIDLWPLVFIVIGINIIFRKMPYIGNITWVLFLGALLWYGSYVGTNGRNYDLFGMTWPWGNGMQIERNADNWSFTGMSSGSYNSNDLLGAKSAELNLSLPAGSLNIGNTDQDALSYVVPNRLYVIDSNTISDVVRYNFKTEPGLRFNNLNGTLNHDFYLSTDIPWNIQINAGAMESNFEMSKIPVETVNINMGAGEIDLKMGDLVKQAYVEVKCGAASVNLTVPDGVGVSVDYKGIVSDNTLADHGFSKENGIYYSNGYDNADKKIDLVIKSAVAQIDVRFD